MILIITIIIYIHSLLFYLHNSLAFSKNSSCRNTVERSRFSVNSYYDFHYIYSFIIILLHILYHEDFQFSGKIAYFAACICNKIKMEKSSHCPHILICVC